MKKERLYRKLASARQFGITTGGWVSLHAAQDHLLLRASLGFVERYYRFYFRDVEAITITHTQRVHGWSILFGAGMLFSALPMLINLALHPVALGFVGFFGILLLVNVARGPTCVARLQTRVQTRKLPLRRVRKAVRVVENLTPVIQAAQAEFATSTPAATAQRRTTAIVEPHTKAEPPPLPGERAPAPPLSHLLAAVSLLLGGVVVLCSAVRPQSAGFAYAAYGAVFVNLGLGLVALAQQRRRRTPRRVQPLPWISVITHALAIPLVYFVYTMIASFQSARTGVAQNFAEVPLGLLRELPGFTIVLWIYGAFALLLSFVWLVLFVFHGSRRSPA